MILYELDVGVMHADVGLERFFASFCGGEPLEVPPPFRENESPLLLEPSDSTRSYAEKLVRGVSSNLEAIDTEIQRVSAHWRLDRMARVDRNLLRIGAFELIFLPDEVPRKVAINEAVEIAKQYGAAETSAFVNGILDRIGK